MIDYKKTGQLIQKRRRELNLTQKDLAEHLGVSDRAVSKWETAKSFPDVSVLKPLAEALNVTVSELLDGEIQDLTNGTITAEKADQTAIRGILVYTRQNLKRYRILLCILAVLLTVLAVTGMHEYNEYRHQPLNFQEDDLTFGDLIFHEEDGSEYRWELNDAFGQELREQIAYYMKNELPQGTSMYGNYYMIDSAEKRAWVELDGLAIFYDVGYYDEKSGDYYTFHWVESAHRILVDLCRELVADENYVYTGQTHFQDGEQTLDINCELTDVRMEQIVKYLETVVMEPENETRPDCWINYEVNNIIRLIPEQYETAGEFEWLYKEIVYQDLTSWRIYDVEFVTEYIGFFGPWIPQYPEGKHHMLFMAPRNFNSDQPIGDKYAVWYYWPEYETEEN